MANDLQRLSPNYDTKFLLKSFIYLTSIPHGYFKYSDKSV